MDVGTTMTITVNFQPTVLPTLPDVSYVIAGLVADQSIEASTCIKVVSHQTLRREAGVD